MPRTNVGKRGVEVICRFVHWALIELGIVSKRQWTVEIIKRGEEAGNNEDGCIA